MTPLKYDLYDLELLLADGEGIREVPSAFQIGCYLVEGEGDEATYFCAVKDCEVTGKATEGMVNMGRFVLCHQHGRKLLGRVRHDRGVERARFFPLTSTLAEAAKRDYERPERIDVARAHMASEPERLETLKVIRRAARRGLTVVKPPSEAPFATTRGTLADQVVPFFPTAVDDEDAELAAMAAMWGELDSLDGGGDAGGFFASLEEGEDARAPACRQPARSVPIRSARPAVARCNSQSMEGDPWEGWDEVERITRADPRSFTSPHDCFRALGETRAYKEDLELHRGDKELAKTCPLHGPRFKRLGWHRAQVIQRGTELGVDWSKPKATATEDNAATRPSSDGDCTCLECNTRCGRVFDKETGQPAEYGVCGRCRKRHSNRARREEKERARREQALLESQRAKDKGCGRKGGGKNKKKGGRK